MDGFCGVRKNTAILMATIAIIASPRVLVFLVGMDTAAPATTTTTTVGRTSTSILGRIWGVLQNAIAGIPIVAASKRIFHDGLRDWTNEVVWNGVGLVEIAHDLASKGNK